MAERLNPETIDGPKIDHLMDDIDELANLATTVSEHNGTLRARLKQKIEDRGYNAKALGYLRAIAKMSDEKRQDFLRTFQPGLKELLGHLEGQSTTDMFDAGEAA